MVWDTDARTKNTTKLLSRDFLLHQTAPLARCLGCVSCSSIFSVNGPDHRIPRYYLPIQFCLIFPILRVFLPSFSVISYLSLLCFCLLLKDLRTPENLSETVIGDVIRASGSIHFDIRKYQCIIQCINTTHSCDKRIDYILLSIKRFHVFI